MALATWVLTTKNCPRCFQFFCRSGSGSQFRNGTCLTNVECMQRSGTAGGNCAAGFGVCCVYMVMECGGITSQNGTYVKNPNFPAAYTDTTACPFTLNKCDSGANSIMTLEFFITALLVFRRLLFSLGLWDVRHQWTCQHERAWGRPMSRRVDNNHSMVFIYFKKLQGLFRKKGNTAS